MPKILSILVFALLFQYQAIGQYKYKVDNQHVNLSPAYYTILDLSSDDQKFSHGAAISVSYSVINKSREKLQRKTSYNRIIDRDIYVKLNLSTYKRAQIHNTLGISAGPAFRVTIPEGMFFEFDGQIGYLRTFLNGDHFVYTEGSIQSTRLLGNNLLSIQGNGTMGWNFQKSNDYPAALFAGVGLMTYFPNNGKWLFQPQLNMGVTFIFIRLKEQYQ